MEGSGRGGIGAKEKGRHVKKRFRQLTALTQLFSSTSPAKAAIPELQLLIKPKTIAHKLY